MNRGKPSEDFKGLTALLRPALTLAFPASGEGKGTGATLKRVTPLILYGTPVKGAAEISVSNAMRMKTFREADEWSGGAWLTSGGKAAVILVGTKALGRAWCGFANGVIYPPSGDPDEKIPEVPPWPYEQRGWWSEGIGAQVLFYDPDDLAAVTRGAKCTWESQPYASMSIDAYLRD
jgi:hypothetical protein